MTKNPTNCPGNPPPSAPYWPVPKCRGQSRGRQVVFQVDSGAVTSLSPPNQWKQQQPRQRGGNTYTVKRPHPTPAFRSTPSSARAPWASTYRFRPVYCCWTSENFASALFVLLHGEFLESFLPHKSVGSMGGWSIRRHIS